MGRTIEFVAMRTSGGGRSSCFAVLVVLVVLAVTTVSTAADDTGNETTTDIPPVEEVCSRTARECRPGIMLPVWEPIGNISAMDRGCRAVVYLLALFYLFIGVSIIADRFMSAIEVITSSEREVTIYKSNGETMVVNVRVWNETVSNLTLMALGSSAPEILLSIIEVCGNDFNAGDLGPGTIVGSAAFNLFVIIGLCVSVIPNGEVRRIKHLRVFFITASWSVFAYLWLYIIIAVISPERVDLWEAIVTFLFFPATVLTAYVADRHIFLYNFLSRKYRGRIAGTTMTAEGRDSLELGDKDGSVVDGGPGAGETQDTGLKEFEKYASNFYVLSTDH